MCARENAANMQMQKGHRRELASPELKRAGEKRKSNILWTLVLQHRNTETTCKLNKFILFYFSALNFVCSPTFLSPPFFLFGLYRLTKFAFHTCLNLNKKKKEETQSFAFHSQNEATRDFLEEAEFLLVSQERGSAVNFVQLFSPKTF